MGMFDDLIPSDTGEKVAGRVGMFEDLIPKKKSAASYGEDIAKAGASGVARGAIGLGGALGDIQELARAGGRKLGFTPPEHSAFGRIFGRETAPTSRGLIQSATEAGVPGLDYEPQTLPGRFARTVGEFLPGAVLGPGGVARNVTRFGVVPGVASEAAGNVAQAVGRPELEPYARGGAALLGGGAAALATRPSVAERAIGAAARGMTRPQVAAMETLMRDAQAAGLPLTRAEAAQAVTNGATRLADIQRVVEGQGGLREMMAQRPAQVEAAGRNAIEQIAPPNAQPATIGPQTAEAAGNTISDVQAAINRRTRPLYAAAEPQHVPQAGALAANEPIYAQTLQEIRGNPALNRPITNLPDDSPVVMDMVRQRLRERANAATSIGQATPSNLEAASYGAVERQAGQHSTAASPELAQARAHQAQLRERYLAPLVAGPLGKLRDTPDTRRAIEALFPRNPVPNSAGEVLDATRALSARNPMAARQLVRAHVESVFNNATRDLQAGPSGFGGASFRAQLVGNRQQGENLAAAIRGLPGGATILPGFDRMLEIMEATGQRQRIGSQTAFNTELQASLKGGGFGKETAALATGAFTKLPTHALERFKEWNLGRNTDALARLLTDPKAEPLFRSLATAPHGSEKALAIATRIALLSQRASNKGGGNKQ